MRELDASFAVVTTASRPNAFKSSISRERVGWTATLKVDYDLRPILQDDGSRSPPNFPSRRGAIAAQRLIKKMGLRIEHAVVLSTKKGLHLRVWLVGSDRAGSRVHLHHGDILRLQALLNDDQKRQQFNYERVARGETGWNVLWNEKARNAVMVSREVLEPDWTDRFRSWWRLPRRRMKKGRA